MSIQKYHSAEILKPKLIDLILENGEKTDNGLFRILISKIPTFYHFKFQIILDPTEFGFSKLLELLQSMNDIVFL